MKLKISLLMSSFLITLSVFSVTNPLAVQKNVLVNNDNPPTHDASDNANNLQNRENEARGSHLVCDSGVNTNQDSGWHPERSACPNGWVMDDIAGSRFECVPINVYNHCYWQAN